MKKYFKQTQPHANLRGAMESGDHSKNGASPKSLMSRGKFFNKMFVVLCMSLFIFMSCGKDDDNNDPSDKPTVVSPDTPVPDPEGTVTANISEDTEIEIPYVGYIKWTGPDNFYFYLYSYSTVVSICDLGEMKGLGNIANIPQTGYSIPQGTNTTVACESGHGYVVKFETAGSNSLLYVLYVRLYVVEPIISTLGGIIGAKVKYQYPFETTLLNLSKETLSFGSNDKNTQTVDINTDATNWTYYCPDSWINVDKNEKTLSISVKATEYVLERTGTITVQANERRKEITITQDPITKTSAPYSLGNIYCENGVTGIVYKVTDNGYHGMILSLDETWCQWSTVTDDGTNLDNGMNNMNVIKQLPQWEDRFPAFKWCDDFNKGTISGWYFPAINELSQVYAGYSGLDAYPGVESNASTVYKVARGKFNSVLVGNGGVALSDYYYYWSSSGDGTAGAYSLYFYNGNKTNYLQYKYKEYSVRAVRAF